MGLVGMIQYQTNSVTFRHNCHPHATLGFRIKWAKYGNISIIIIVTGTCFLYSIIIIHIIFRDIFRIYD